MKFNVIFSVFFGYIIVVIFVYELKVYYKWLIYCKIIKKYLFFGENKKKYKDYRFYEI